MQSRQEKRSVVEHSNRIAFQFKIGRQWKLRTKRSFLKFNKSFKFTSSSRGTVYIINEQKGGRGEKEGAQRDDREGEIK